MDVLKVVRQYIVDNFLFEDDPGLTAEKSFLEHGIIDSTGILELATFLEKAFHFSIQDHEFIPENLDSLARIERFVESKINSKQETLN